MKKTLIPLLVVVCIFSFVAFCGKSIIISIRGDSSGGAMLATEVFYEDADNVYYFPTISSQSIIVTYLNGDSEDIRSALNSGRATIADLDRFGIKYYTEPRK